MGKGSKRRPVTDQADPNWYDKVFGKKIKETVESIDEALQPKKASNDE
jgi:hypothetical protein